MVVKEEPSKTQSEQKPLERDRFLTVCLLIYRLVYLCVIVGGIVLIVYFGITKPVELSSGKETGITIFYRAILDFDLKMIISVALNLGLLGLWWRERHIRKTSIRREHVRVEQFESREDPNRTSSGLKE